MSKWQKEKRLVLEASQKILEKGLVTGTSGNVSLRLLPENNGKLLAITPSRRYYDLLTIDDIQIINFEGEPVEGNLTPSTEKMLHIGIYQMRKDVNAVIHTHSVFATTLSVTGLEIPIILDEQTTFLGGKIKLAKYALPGSQELVENALAALEGRNGVLLANHGVVGVGQTMRDALTACELVENTAKVYLLALMVGKVNPLPTRE